MSTQFGIISTGINNVRFTPEAKVNVANNLGLSLVRHAINIVAYHGPDKTISAYAKAGFKAFLNLNYNTSNSDPENQTTKKDYPLTTPKFCQQIFRLLFDGPINTVAYAIENEPLNENYFYTERYRQYLRELACASSIIAAQVDMCCDGGLPAPLVLQLINRNTKSKRQSKIERLAAVIAEIPYMPVRFVNIHFNTNNINVFSSALNDVVTFLEEETGLPVICNEFGIHTQKESDIIQLIKKLRQVNLQYAIVYNGQNKIGKALSLCDQSGKLNNVGTIFKAALQNE